MLAGSFVFGLEEPEIKETENDGLATRKEPDRLDIGSIRIRDNLKGRSFGRRRVLGSEFKAGKHWLAVVRCDCERVDVVQTASLKCGDANQCPSCRGRELVKRLAERLSNRILIGSTVKTTRQWSEEPDAMPYHTIRKRLLRGWEPIDAVFGNINHRIPAVVMTRYGLSGHRVV